MAPVLASLRGALLANVRQQLEKDAASHAGQGMVLEHLWQNTEDPEEVLFLFRVASLEQCQQRMKTTHARARQENPDAPLPHLTFLQGD
jgi:hypothetical protein